MPLQPRRRSIDWKPLDSVFEPRHARFAFPLEEYDSDKGLNSHGDLPHCSPSEYILEIDLLRVELQPSLGVGKKMARHFENCRRTSPTSTMALLVIPKWAKFDDLTQH
jgi:hypothetical protein